MVIEGPERVNLNFQISIIGKCLSPNVRESGISECEKFSLCMDNFSGGINPESWAFESGIHFMESGIPTSIGNRNYEESGFPNTGLSCFNLRQGVTKDQAQFERFSYILSNGYRWNSAWYNLLQVCARYGQILAVTLIGC